MGGTSGTNGRGATDEPGPGGRTPGTVFRATRGPATAAQVLIAGQTVVQLSIAAAGGFRSGLAAALAPVSALLLVGSAVAFLVWFLACRANAELLAPGSQRYTERLTLWGFFVPVLWWIPVRAALDIRNASGSTRGTALIIGWWAAFVAKTAGSLAVDGTTTPGGGTTPYDLVVGVLAAVAATLVIRLITADVEAATVAGPGALPPAAFPAA